MPLRRRILFVDHVSKVLGGAEVNLLELLALTAAREHWDIHVACAPDSPLDQALNGMGLARHAHGFASSLNELRVVGRRLNLMAKFRGWLELRQATLRLNRCVAEVRPSVLLSCTNKDHFVAGRVARSAGLPSVWWVNDVLSADFFSWPVRKVFVRQANRFATRLVPVSDFGRTALLREGVPRDRYRRSSEGNLRTELGISRDTPLMGLVGRITPWKGQDLLVKIAAEWIRRNRRGCFVIIGRAFNEDAPFEASVRESIAQLGLSERVRFASFRSDIASTLSEFDVLLHCSIKPEPFGRVIIEAMAVGTPVLAARAGGVPEIVRTEAEGALAEPGNVSEYVHQLAALLDDPALRERRVNSARQAVETRFTLKRVFADFESLLAGLCAVSRCWLQVRVSDLALRHACKEEIRGRNGDQEKVRLQDRRSGAPSYHVADARRG